MVPRVRLNFVDQVLRHGSRGGAAVIGIDEDGTRTVIDWAELPGRVGAVAAELRRLGVRRVTGWWPICPISPRR